MPDAFRAKINVANRNLPASRSPPALEMLRLFKHLEHKLARCVENTLQHQYAISFYSRHHCVSGHDDSSSFLYTLEFFLVLQFPQVVFQIVVPLFHDALE